jgi:hypothetical protein
MDIIKVENDTLGRDPNTGAIVETDTSKLIKYRARKTALQQKDDMIYSLNERINKLEQLIERMTISNG